MKLSILGRSRLVRPALSAVCLYIACLSFLSAEPVATELKHARQFEIYNHAWGKELIVYHTPERRSDAAFVYYIVKDRKGLPVLHAEALVIEKPVERMVMLSTSMLAHVAELDLLNELTGVSQFQTVNSPDLRNKIQRNELFESGREHSLRLEALVKHKPDIIMGSAFFPSKQAYFKKLKALNLPMVWCADFLESTPLARAEWIKFTAAFFDKEEAAKRYFDAVEMRYEKLVKQAQSAKRQPRVFFNVPWRSTWYMPSGSSYLSELVKDAGGLYLWSDKVSEKSLPLNFERVFHEANGADFWLHTSSIKSLEQLLKADPRYKHFSAFKNKQIYNNDKRSQHGNDYWESGPICPDKLLADLISIFHPELMPNHALCYYRRLPQNEKLSKTSEDGI